MTGWHQVLVASALCAAAVSWLVSQVPASSTPLGVAPEPSLNCTRPPQFQAVPADVDPSATSSHGGWRWWRSGYLQADVCDPGTLTLVGTGTLLEEQPPRIVVVLGTRRLKTLEFTGRQRHTVRLPERGRLRLIFDNAESQGVETRYVAVHGARLSGEPCPNLLPGSSPLLVASAQGVSLTACHAGTLTLQLTASRAGGAWPLLKVQQGRDLFRELITRSTSTTTVRVPVAQGPIALTLGNPFFQVAQERRLIFTSAQIVLD